MMMSSCGLVCLKQRLLQPVGEGVGRKDEGRGGIVPGGEG